MFRLRLHPTPLGFALGIFAFALWALLWVWFLAQLAGGPQKDANQRRPVPELSSVAGAERGPATA